jgi:hypothetical protein
VSNWIGGCELYNLGSYWIFLLWIMDVDPFPRIRETRELKKFRQLVGTALVYRTYKATT